MDVLHRCCAGLDVHKRTVVACVGEERGARFLGRSQIVAPSGTVLAEASKTDPDMLVQDLDFSEADVNNVVVRPGEHEMDCLADRRPELYGRVAEQSLASVH